jgi:AcrR family transcriptional regulator
MKGALPGRPREFCTEAALDAAMRVFAEKGYEGASLTDLTEAMGINRPSMYAAYGNKEQLFIKALDRYAQAGTTRLHTCLGGGSARDGIDALLRDMVVRYTDTSGTGCAFVTQAPTQEMSATCQRDFEARRQILEITLRKRLEQAIADGELPASASPTDLSRFYSVIVQGIALQAQHGGTREQLMGVVDVAMASWPTRPTGRAAARPPRSRPRPADR